MITVHKAQTTGAKCRVCPEKIRKGQQIVRIGVGRFAHYTCWEERP